MMTSPHPHQHSFITYRKIFLSFLAFKLQYDMKGSFLHQSGKREKNNNILTCPKISHTSSSTSEFELHDIFLIMRWSCHGEIHKYIKIFLNVLKIKTRRMKPDAAACRVFPFCKSLPQTCCSGAVLGAETYWGWIDVLFLFQPSSLLWLAWINVCITAPCPYRPPAPTHLFTSFFYLHIYLFIYTSWTKLLAAQLQQGLEVE